MPPLAQKILRWPWLCCLDAAGKGLVRLLCFLIVLDVLVPFTPVMPSAGLDPSWMWGVGLAAARHLAFGHDLIFTYGPYIGVWSRWYIPGSDGFVMAASLLLGGLHLLLLGLLSHRTPLRWIVLYAVVMGGLAIGRDAQLLSYLMLLALLLHRVLATPGVISARWRGLLVLAFLPLGLLPLIKVSYAVPALALALPAAALTWRRRLPAVAALMLFTPLLAMLFFWWLAGQTFAALPAYFHNSLPIIGGYTEAMATDFPGDPARTIALYVLASLVLVRFIWKTAPGDWMAKGLLAGYLLLFLFFAFKFGFVRNDGHLLTTMGTLLLTVIGVRLALKGGDIAPALVLALIAWWGVDQYFNKSSTETLYHHLRTALMDARSGLRTRLSHPDKMADAYRQAVADVQSQFPLPAYAGTSDIYSLHQDYLLASGNAWAPRPILQSYSAYTPALLQANADHLAGAQAPDQVLFATEAVDHRLPALEEGLSWPLLASRYQATGLLGDLAVLEKRKDPTPALNWQPLYEGKGELGKPLALPGNTLPTYAEIEIKPTLLGRLFAMAYKPPALTLTLQLADGDSLQFRTASGMMQTRFLLSPVVLSTQEFMLQAAGREDLFRDRAVRSLQLSPAFGGHWLWQTSYHIRLSTTHLAAGPGLPDTQLIDAARPQPNGVTISRSCDVAWGDANGHDQTSGPSDKLPASRLFSLAAELKHDDDGKAHFPQQFFFTLTGADGSHRFVATHAMPSRSSSVDNALDTGRQIMTYHSLIDTSQLPPQDYHAGVATLDEGLLTLCSEPGPTLIVGQTHN